MREMDRRSREIIEIIGDVVKEIPKECMITVPGFKCTEKVIRCPEIHYVFGNARYVKDNLDELSRTPAGNSMKFPLIALFCPFNEKRNSPDYFSEAKVRVLIAHSSVKKWSNEQRLVTSFQNVLRPIYNRFIESLKEDGRLDFGYDEHVRHDYSENYSYGRYGAFTDTGEEVSEPIDAIVLTNLELKVKNPNCI